MCSFLLLLASITANVESQSLVMVINGVTNCLPFDEISLVDGYQVGWIKVISCIEETDQFSRHQNTTLLAPYAISLKITPPGGTMNTNYTKLAVIAKPYSNPVSALRDNKELSYQYNPSNGNVNGFANIANWIGSSEATDRLRNSCYGSGAPQDLSTRIYHACNNYCGMHIISDFGKTGLVKQCDWENCGGVGENIEVYFGFEPMICNTTISPTEIPTIEPTTNTSINPTKNPTINPTIIPSYNPSAFPSETPTVSPTNPTNLPSTTPTAYPSKSPQAFLQIDVTIEPTLNKNDGKYKTTNISDINELNTTKQVEAAKTNSQIITIVIVAVMICCVLLLFMVIVIWRLRMKNKNTKIEEEMNIAMSSVDSDHKRIGSVEELKSKQVVGIAYNMNAENDEEIGGDEIQTMGNNDDMNEIDCHNDEFIVGDDDEMLDTKGENNQNIESNFINNNEIITMGESDGDSDSVFGTSNITNGEQ